MTPWGPIVIGLGYILGLLSTGITIGSANHPMASYGLFILGLVLSLWLPRHWRLGPTGRQWLLAAIVSLVGAAYCLWRIPQPAASDISYYTPGEYRVYGEVLSRPKATRNDQGQFWLNVDGIKDLGENRQFVERRPTRGKLYVTAPLDKTDHLYPGKMVKVKGYLKKPDIAKSSKEFDFQKYLAKQGSFAIFSGQYVDNRPGTGGPQPGLWQIRQRIVNAQSRWLGDRGTLISAMILGRRAVDLPHDLRDAFIEAGLAHTLAASGFHVALVLSSVLTLLKWQPVRTQAIGGSIALLIYVGLTGLQPSVMRAAIMGFGAMLGLALERKVKPLACLGLAAFLLLVWNPRWIWDIGFQLSVTATLGLMVMAMALAKRLDWLPGAIATLLSVPIAAYIWTIPLQLYHFGSVPSYSIALNILATPLVTVISLGGFISAMVSLIWPLAGGAISWLLAIPVQLLITLVNFFNQLPGNQLSVETIPAWLVVVTYGFYGSITIWLAHRSRTA